LTRIDPFATPKERSQAYLRSANEARTIAENSRFPAIRERYLSLALFWTTLANEVRDGNGTIAAE